MSRVKLQKHGSSVYLLHTKELELTCDMVFYYDVIMKTFQKCSRKYK